jgi:hypothetical protein
MVLELTIQTGKGKGRSFRASVFAYATAPALFDLAAGADDLRPILLMAAASEEESRAVLENLRAGNRALLSGPHLNTGGSPLELMRSAGYAFALQRAPEGTLLTAYLPGLFDFSPGLLDAEGVRFVLLPARADLDEVPVSEADVAAVAQHVDRLDEATPPATREMCAMATMWAAYLDQRSELPIPPQTDFRAQLFVAALARGLASKSLPLGSGDLGPGQHEALTFRAYIAEGFPLVPGVACRATHDELADFLAEEIRRYERLRARAARGRRPARLAKEAA